MKYASCSCLLRNLDMEKRYFLSVKEILVAQLVSFGSLLNIFQFRILLDFIIYLSLLSWQIIEFYSILKK